MPVPKTKADELSDVINRELHQPRSSELALRRIERELAPLRSAPDADIRNEALVLSAVLETLRFNVDATRQRFEQALTATGHHSNVYVNYAVALTALGLFREALGKIEIAVQKSPEIETLRLALDFSGHAFETEKVDHYAAWLKRLNAVESDQSIEKTLESAAWQRAVLDSPGVNRSLLLNRYETARAIARAHNLRIPDERASISIRGVLIEWAAYCDAEEVAQMNLEAACAMGTIESDPSELLVSFGYVQQSGYAQQAA